jgi:hypothetical protein
MLSRKGRKRKYYEVDGGWKCRSCEAVFSEKSMFKNHNDVCGQTSFKCGQCQTTFDDVELLKEHLATTVVGINSLLCPIYCAIQKGVYNSKENIPCFERGSRSKYLHSRENNNGGSAIALPRLLFSRDCKFF